MPKLNWMEMKKLLIVLRIDFRISEKIPEFLIFKVIIQYSFLNCLIKNSRYYKIIFTFFLLSRVHIKPIGIINYLLFACLK